MAWFGNEKISFLVIYIGCAPLILSPLFGYLEASKTTKHSALHMLEGLLPMFITDFFMIYAFVYTNYAWENPCSVIFIGGIFFVLNVTRLIISSVSKTKYSMLKDFHLSWSMTFCLIIILILRFITCKTITPILNLK